MNDRLRIVARALVRQRAKNGSRFDIHSRSLASVPIFEGRALRDAELKVSR